MSAEIQIDIDLTYRAARARWLKESAPRRSLADWFALFTPWSIVIVFAAAYALSAPHTAHVMNLITPGMGFVAPIAVEFALIWSAFEIRRAKSSQTAPLPAAQFLRWFMLVIAVATNAAGGLSAVVAGTGVTDLSAEALWSAFSGLSVVTQVALLMVIVAALAVPITAEATGGAIAQLVFERRARDDFREQAWQGVAFEQTARAAYVQYHQAGYTPDESRKLAVSAVRGYLTAGAGKGTLKRQETTPGAGTALLVSGHVSDAEAGETLETPMERARAWLASNPAGSSMPVRQAAELANVSAATMHRARKGGGA